MGTGLLVQCAQRSMTDVVPLYYAYKVKIPANLTEASPVRELVPVSSLDHKCHQIRTTGLKLRVSR